MAYPQDPPTATALAIPSATVPRAVMVEAVENALHAFGVGRLDLAFAVLRDLLGTLRDGRQ